jgi:hypothetical protein
MQLPQKGKKYGITKEAAIQISRFKGVPNFK